jgi:hypothetical protein
MNEDDDVGIWTSIDCKFCHKQVQYNQLTMRVYEQDKLTLHVDNCERRKKHYKELSARAAEEARQKRGKL